MGYYPLLIVRKKDLDDNIKQIEQDLLDSNEEVTAVARELYQASTLFPIRFDDIELVLFKPELSHFNDLVRSRLRELNIDFRTYW